MKNIACLFSTVCVMLSFTPANGGERVEKEKARTLFYAYLKSKGENSDGGFISLVPFGKESWIISRRLNNDNWPAHAHRYVMYWDGLVYELTTRSLSDMFSMERITLPEPTDRERVMQEFIKLHKVKDFKIITKASDIPGYAKHPPDPDIAEAIRAPFSFGNITTVVYTYQQDEGIVSRYRFTFGDGMRFKEAECAILGKSIGEWYMTK